MGRATPLPFYFAPGEVVLEICTCGMAHNAGENGTRKDAKQESEIFPNSYEMYLLKFQNQTITCEGGTAMQGGDQDRGRANCTF